MEAAVTAPVLSPASAGARLASLGLSAAQWAVLEATGGRTVKQSVSVVMEVRRQPRQCHESVIPASDWLLTQCQAFSLAGHGVSFCTKFNFLVVLPQSSYNESGN